MKLTKEELTDIIEILSEAETFRPLIKGILDTIESYGPELSELPKKMSKWLVRNRIESVHMYIEAGFHKDDAIMMTLDDVWACKRAGRNASHKK